MIMKCEVNRTHVLQTMMQRTYLCATCVTNCEVTNADTASATSKTAQASVIIVLTIELQPPHEVGVQKDRVKRGVCRVCARVKREKRRIATQKNKQTDRNLRNCGNN